VDRTGACPCVRFTSGTLADTTFDCSGASAPGAGPAVPYHGPTGRPFALRVDAPVGVYPYLCLVHPEMKGRVTVTE
jgi:plastocyanin